MKNRSSDQAACFIVNPCSAGGATGRRIPELRKAASRYFVDVTIQETTHPGHASELAAQALRSSYPLICAVGGDGTANEVVQGLLGSVAPSSCDTTFGVLPAGTGSDLVRSIGMPKGIDAAMRVLYEGVDRRVDAMRVDFLEGGTGQSRSRFGINVVGLGVSGEVALRANRSSKRWGGTLTFLGATVAALTDYRPVPSLLRWEDANGAKHDWEGDLLVAFVANGLYCGGGMYVGRGGAIDDGLLELTVVPKLSAGVLLTQGFRLYSGRLGGLHGVQRVSVRSVEVEPSTDAPLRLDVDGESVGRASAKIAILKGVLRVRGLWSI